MEGLECKEVKFSDLFIDNEKFRIDDEFFMKKYICAYQQIKSNSHFILENEISVLTDFHANGSYETIAENFSLLDSVDYAYMVRTTDLETNNFTQDVKYISEQSYNFLSKSKVFGGELLINKIGTPGKCYLMPNLNKPVSLGMNLFLLRLKENSLLNEKFLYVFFNTEIGKNIINRKVNGTVPLTIDKMAIKSLFIPKLGNNIMGEVANLVDLKFDLDNQSKQKYAEAETLLLKNLGLQNFQPTNQSVNIKALKDSFLQTGRLDAEFYQPIYEQLESNIKNYPNGFEKLEYFIDNYSTGYPYQSETYTNNGIPLIRINNINSGRLDMSNSVCIPNSDIDLSIKDVANENDVLISMSGTIGNSCVIPKGLKAVVNQRIMRITPKNIQVEILPLILNSLIGKLQLERIGTGGVQTNISSNDIKEIYIPKIDEKTQTQIANYVRQSNELQEQAKQLLAQAKQSVETEIEQNSLQEREREREREAYK